MYYRQPEMCILGQRDKDEYDKLDENRKYGGPGGVPFPAEPDDINSMAKEQ